jgi:hypothetical protein
MLRYWPWFGIFPDIKLALDDSSESQKTGAGSVKTIKNHPKRVV